MDRESPIQPLPPRSRSRPEFCDPTPLFYFKKPWHAVILCRSPVYKRLMQHVLICLYYYIHKAHSACVCNFAYNCYYVNMSCSQGWLCVCCDCEKAFWTPVALAAVQFRVKCFLSALFFPLFVILEASLVPLVPLVLSDLSDLSLRCCLAACLVTAWLFGSLQPQKKPKPPLF